MAKDWVEIEIVNWAKYNPRTDRANYTWFRLQNDIATEPKFHGLTPSQKFIAVCLFAEVSKSGGKPARIKLAWLADQIKVKTPEILRTIEVLVSEGVFRCPLVSLVPATNDTNDTDVTDERYERGVTDGRCPPATASGLLPPLVEIWNQNSAGLAKVKECRNTRLKHVNARWGERPDPDFWTAIVLRIAQSPFCCGDNDRKWRADFDWLVKPETAGKVLEGKYDARTSAVVTQIDPEKKRLDDEFEAEMAKARAQLQVKL